VTQPHRLWTEPLVEIMLGRLNADAKFRKLAAGVEAKIQLRCTDTPDGTDIVASYHIHDSRLDCTSFDEQPAPAPMRNLPLDKSVYLARTTAPYSIWVKLDKGEMGVIDAIISPDYVFEGAKLKVLRHLRMFSRISEMSQEMEKRYT